MSIATNRNRALSNGSTTNATSASRSGRGSTSAATAHEASKGSKAKGPKGQLSVVENQESNNNVRSKDTGETKSTKAKTSDKKSDQGVSLSNKELDMELVRRVQRGDKSGYDLLVLRYQNKILNLVSRYVHDHHEAQDVAQEAFIKAYRGLANFRGDSAFYTWLYRIAINTAKNHLITASRKISADGPDAQEAEQYDGAHALRDYESPERNALNEEIAGVIESSIESLPDDLRTALTLREFEGLSYEEIANVMDCPIGTVRSRIFRARETVDKSLDPLLDESSQSLL